MGDKQVAPGAFEEKALQAIDRIETRQETILKDTSRLDGETKKAIADLDGAKLTINEFQQQLTKVQRKLDEQVRLNYTNPLDRICADEEKRNYITGSFRGPRHSAFGAGKADCGWRERFQPGRGGYGSGDEQPDLRRATDLRAMEHAGVVPVGSRTQILPIMTARPTAYWVNTQGAVINTEGAITGTSVTLTIREAAAYIPCADALLEDSDVDMARYLLDQLAQAVAYRWTGPALPGMARMMSPTAITRDRSGGTAATAGAGNITSDLLDLDDFVRCLTTVSAGLLNRPCKWWIHPTILAKLALIRDNNGRSIFQNGLEAPAPGAVDLFSATRWLSLRRCRTRTALVRFWLCL